MEGVVEEGKRKIRVGSALSAEAESAWLSCQDLPWVSCDLFLHLFLRFFRLYVGCIRACVWRSGGGLVPKGRARGPAWVRWGAVVGVHVVCVHMCGKEVRQLSAPRPCCWSWAKPASQPKPDSNQSVTEPLPALPSAATGPSPVEVG